MKIQFLFKWYDLWVGIFYDRKNRWIYILPFPTVGIILKLPTPPVKKLNIPDVIKSVCDCGNCFQIYINQYGEKTCYNCLKPVSQTVL